jgi:hypothetical protein
MTTKKVTKVMNKAEKARAIVARMDAKGAKPAKIVNAIEKATDMNTVTARTYLYAARKRLAEGKVETRAPAKHRKAA